MVVVRRSDERGTADHGWLRSRHTFSFADYHDPKFMGFRALRVINEDRVEPGRGFGTHPHRDMEIVSYVIAGALEHKDSMGNGSIIRPGDVQRMTAGTGVTHSEFNHSNAAPVHFLQIWLLPDRRGLPPSYEQRQYPEDERRDVLRLVASRDGRHGSVTVHQDADVYATVLSPGATVERAMAISRHAWVQVVRGQVALNDTLLIGGDGAAVTGEPAVTLAARAESELLLFDLA